MKFSSRAVLILRFSGLIFLLLNRLLSLFGSVGVYSVVVVVDVLDRDLCELLSCYGESCLVFSTTTVE